MVVGACCTAIVTCHEQAVVTASGGLRGPKSFKLKDIVDSALEMAAEQGHVVMRTYCLFPVVCSSAHPAMSHLPCKHSLLNLM